MVAFARSDKAGCLVRFYLQGVSLGQVGCLSDHTEGVPYCAWPIAGYLFCQLHGLFKHLTRRACSVYHAHGSGFTGIYLPGGEYEVCRPAGPYQPAQCYPPAPVGHKAKAGFRKTEHRSGVNYPEITPCGKFCSSPIGTTVNGRDNRNRQKNEIINRGSYPANEGFNRSSLMVLYCLNQPGNLWILRVYVKPGAEGVTGPGYDHHPWSVLL